jgi:hypothetical protein
MPRREIKLDKRKEAKVLSFMPVVYITYRLLKAEKAARLQTSIEKQLLVR